MFLCLCDSKQLKTGCECQINIIVLHIKQTVKIEDGLCELDTLQDSLSLVLYSTRDTDVLYTDFIRILNGNNQLARIPLVLRNKDSILSSPSRMLKTFWTGT